MKGLNAIRPGLNIFRCIAQWVLAFREVYISRHVSIFASLWRRRGGKSKTLYGIYTWIDGKLKSYWGFAFANQIKQKLYVLTFFSPGIKLSFQ